MFKFIKNLFKSSDTSYHNPSKNNVSEPVITLVELWKKDKKRFKFEYSYPWGTDTYEINYKNRAMCIAKIADVITNESFSFNLYLGPDAFCRNYYNSILLDSNFRHKVYPVLAYVLTSYPTWLKQEEIKYIEEKLKEYFLKRIKRYIELIDYRAERTHISNLHTTEIGKQKERSRLINIYKGE